jgi:tRNA (mo5U34)-methyltransferase
MMIPDNLTGLSVLDIGCWDGFYSFECEKRGAERVVASDVWETSGRSAFDFARDQLGSKVEPLEVSVYDLDPHAGRFDVVLFLGVLYHLKHPLLAIEKVASMTKPGGLAIVDTVIDTQTMRDLRPAAVFHPGGEVNNDPTTWWSPNPSAVAAMLMTTGFAEVKNVTRLYEGNRSVFHAIKATDAECDELAEQEYKDRHRQVFYGPWPGK